MAEADSLVISDATWEWYQTTVLTRQRAQVQKLLCQTRWRDNDLAGRILNTGAGKSWTILTLRSVAELDDGDALGREPGEVLWVGGPKPLSVADGEISSRAYSAIYQQRPLSTEGSLFKEPWFAHRYTVLPRMKRVAIFVDGAWKTGLQNDFSAIGVWGTDGIDYYLVHAWHGRVEYPELKLKVVDIFNRFATQLGVLPMLCVEDAASGMALVQELSRTTGIPIIGIPAKGSKYARAEAITPLFEAGKVRLPAEAEWLDVWKDEHLRFPVGMHDDFVDTTSGALARLSTASSLLREFDRMLHGLQPGAAPETIPRGIDPRLPLLIGCDFEDAAHQCWEIAQVHTQIEHPNGFEFRVDRAPVQLTRMDTPGWTRQVLRFVDEIAFDDMGSRQMADIFIARHGAHARRTGIVLYGDSSGATQTQLDGISSNWGVVLDALTLAGIRFSYAVKANGRVTDRIVAFDAQLRSGDGIGCAVDIVACPELLADCEGRTRWNERGTDLDKHTDARASRSFNSAAYICIGVRDAVALRTASQKRDTTPVALSR